MTKEIDQYELLLETVDDGEKTYLSWATGGAHETGEFYKICLKRILPDGEVLERVYTADTEWLKFSPLETHNEEK
jgi:hypothetical protein